jgi:hypothetical protein
LLELARDLCAVIEHGEMTGEEALEALAGLRALLDLLTIPHAMDSIEGRDFKLCRENDGGRSVILLSQLV